MRFYARPGLVVFSSDTGATYATLFGPSGSPCLFRPDASHFDNEARDFTWAFEYGEPLAEGQRFVFASAEREVAGVVGVGATEIQVAPLQAGVVVRDDGVRPARLRDAPVWVPPPLPMVAPSATAPLVSVIVIAGTTRPFLAAALDSLIRQDVQEWEAVVVECVAEGDRPVVYGQLAKVPDARIRVVRHEHLEYPPFASRKWNRALAEARGDFVAFLDDDDMKEGGWLRAMSDPLRARSDLAATVCSGTCIDADGARYGEVFAAPSLDHGPLVARCNFVTTGQLMVRRSVVAEIGGFDEALGCAEDYDFCIRLGGRPWQFVGGARCLKRDSRSNACYHPDVVGHTQAALRLIMWKLGIPPVCHGCGKGFVDLTEPFVWAVPEVGFRPWHYGCTGLRPG